MASDIIVRAALPEDAPDICRLNREFNGDDTADAEMIALQLQNPGAEHCLVCVHSGETVGFICGICFPSLCYRAPVGQLTELYVQPSARRCGAATALVQAMVSHLHALGASELMLLTGEDNSAAQALYERCGFIRQDERCYQLFF